MLLRVDEKVVTEVNDKLDSGFTLAYTAFGEAFSKWGIDWEAVPGDFEFAREFWELSRVLLENGRLKPARGDVNRGGKKGFEGVLEGLKDLKEGRVSGVKLVYTL